MLKARLLWHDVGRVIAACEEADDEAEFRVQWFCSVVMLRAVGHVLKYYDARDDAKLEGYLGELLAEWKSDERSTRIFFEFLWTERNSAVKEYEFTDYTGNNAVPLVVESDDAVSTFDLDVALYRPFEDGRFGGEDARDLLTEARTWWDEQLARVEAFLSPGSRRRDSPKKI